MSDDHNLFIRPPLWLPVIVVLLGGFFYIGGKYVETRDKTTASISVSGEGKSQAMPDIAELSFGIQVQRQTTAKQAMDILGKGMEKILAAVKKAGIEDKDINTQSLSLNPSYDWTTGQQVMKGFDASQSLTVKVRDLDKVSDVLAAATNAGANQAGGVNFTVDDPEKARAEAREKAIEQAQQKAITLANQLGMSLGKITGFSEGGGSMPPILYGRGGGMAMDAKAMEMAPTPVPVGEQEVNVQVTITYDLE
ncbi:SIMPL domain-containing protein [Candidatus Uhrbacteria bacterium]|nr:SIMPL domain-containing protein [Candidatus Uhrbacteria bacterium]